MKNELHITVDVYGGARIKEAAAEGIDLAKQLGLNVYFSFNGVRCCCSPNGSINILVKNYHKQLVSDSKYKFASSSMPHS